MYWRRRGIRLRHLTLFELSDFKNSLKSLASAGVAIEGPSQKFERPQPLLDWPGQPVLHRIVRIGQTHDGKLRAVQPELLEPVLSHGFSLPPAQARFAALSEWLTILPEPAGPTSTERALPPPGGFAFVHASRHELAPRLWPLSCGWARRRSCRLGWGEPVQQSP